MPATQPVKSIEAIMSTLKKKGRENTRAIYARHGMPVERTFGASTADVKAIAKTIKGDQALALELYKTGMMEAMYLAGMVADGSQMTRKQLEEWCEGAIGLRMISEYTVPWVTVESPHARDLAMQWIKSKNEHVASTGWCTYAGLLSLRPDEALDLAEIEKLLGTVVKDIDGAQNRVRYTMNNFVIATGSYVKPLLKQAKGAAKQIGDVSVAMGETSCQVPLAAAAIVKVEAAGRAGQKRKTIRC
ncbi:MAG TPA: DNA alkylation repair protein [Candidatus Angelobacter sp.]|nr:DNA alkylation repair protein [Candidatus Angelobacter sp.]